MTTSAAQLDFGSPSEFRATCEALAMRMHYLNRVAMGESGFNWEVADMLARLGRVFEAEYKSKDTRAAFGDGYTKGNLSRDERRAYLFALLYEG